MREEDVTGLKYFDKLAPLLARLHEVGCERDKAGNRKLHFDQYCMLVLLFLFNPVVRSLRAIEQASELRKVQRKLGCQRASLGSLSEATRRLPAGTAEGNHRRTGQTTGTHRPRSAAERRATHPDAGRWHAC